MKGSRLETIEEIMQNETATMKIISKEDLQRGSNDRNMSGLSECKRKGTTLKRIKV